LEVTFNLKKIQKGYFMFKKILAMVFSVAAVQTISLQAAYQPNQPQLNNYLNAQLTQAQRNNILNDQQRGYDIHVEPATPRATAAQPTIDDHARELAQQRAVAARRAHRAQARAIQHIAPVQPPFGAPVRQDASVRAVTQNPTRVVARQLFED
jgi:hypothetical protein